MNESQQHEGECRVSIALCTYNGERYLEEQLNGFLKQTRRPFELVVCDDGSSDSTLNIIEKFARTAPFPVRIQVNPSNLGSSKNFEQALGLCTGDFIAMSDQDDVWLPNKLEVLARLLKGNSKLGGVFSDSELIDERSRLVGRSLWTTFGFGPAQQEKFLRGRADDVLLTRVVVTGATLMVRAAARNLFLPLPESWVHDGWIAWMLAVHSEMSFSPQRLIRYRIHSGQQVGVGANSFSERIRRGGRRVASDYLNLANELSQLRDHLLSAPPPQREELAARLQGKIDHCRRCASMPGNPILRLGSVLRHFGDYRKYSRPFRSMSKDMLSAFQG